MKKLIYIVDDEPLQLHYLQAALRKSNYRVESFSDPNELLRAMEHTIPDAAVVDLIMPEISGVDLIREIRKRSPKVPLIAVTAYPEIESAVGAVRAGANDYLKKPFQTAELQLVVERLLQAAYLRDNLDTIVDKNAHEYSLDAFIGDSPAIQRVRIELRRLADITNANVLITGKNGVGKSYAARILHYAHPDSSKRLIELNCAKLPKTELECELFGKDEKQLNGSVIHHPSLCDVAEGGTILLDYISHADKDTQEQLAEYLAQHGKAAAAGEGALHKDICRIIAASTIDPTDDASASLIDPHLFEQLSLFHIRIPSLKERENDVLLLAQYFIEQSESSISVQIHGLTERAKQALLAYDWPGNVRELKSVIERALVTCATNVIDEQDLHIGSTYHTKGDETSISDTLASLRELEIQQIRRVLAYTNGDVSKAAEILGISRKSLWERRKRYSLD